MTSVRALAQLPPPCKTSCLTFCTAMITLSAGEQSERVLLGCEEPEFEWDLLLWCYLLSTWTWAYGSQWVSLQIRLRTFRPRTELSACPVLVVLKKSSVNGEVVELSIDRRARVYPPRAVNLAGTSLLDPRSLRKGGLGHLVQRPGHKNPWASQTC